MPRACKVTSLAFRKASLSSHRIGAALEDTKPSTAASGNNSGDGTE